MGSDGRVWGNAGYAAGTNGDWSGGIWWGATCEDDTNTGLVGQLAHSDTGVATGEELSDAYMIFTTSGSLTSYDGKGNVIRQGTYSISGYDGTYNQPDKSGTLENWAMGTLTTNAILFPFQINGGGTVVDELEIVYLDADQMQLIYAPEGEGTGICWSECTWWVFRAEDSFSETDTVGTEFATSDFYYKIISSSEVCVSYWPDENDAVSAINAKVYVGDMSIPSSVTYNGTTYSVTSINDSTFKKCTSLTSITIPESVTSIGDEAFYNCTSLMSISIPESVTIIGSYAFGYCSSLTSITIPDGVTSIGSGTFFECTSITSITITESVTSIGSFAFYYCTSLTSVTIPESVTSIDSGAFFDCASLTSVTFGDNSALKSIGSTAFSCCTSLTDITIPESVTSISTYAFEGCTSLTSVTCLAISPPTIYETSFEYVTATLHVPSSALSDYQSADYWSDFSEILGDAD